MIPLRARLRTGLFLFVLFVAILLSFSAEIFAQAETCVSNKCHAAMGKDKVVHNPVKDGACTTCHQAKQELEKKTKHPGNLTITLVQQGAELCSMCHEPKNKKKVVHAPVMGDCTTCHNPHQSPHKGMLKEAVPKLCFQCHPDSMMKSKVMHPPVAGGECSGCHDNHQSDFPHRLVKGGNAVCYTCHPDKEEGVKNRKVVHAPVRQSCVQCHNPHGAPSKALLSSPVPSFCSNCHPTEASLTQKAITRHAPMNDAKVCKNCHDPHFADQPKLLPTAQMDLCLGCHNKELNSEKGTIIDMKAFLEANKDGHGPVKNKDCVTCHNPHGSDYWRLLVKYYPSDFYTSYSDGKYGLCFACHSRSAFTERITIKATNFRDGEQNLHYLHVNKIRKGRSCRSCHEVHASSGLPKHMKEYVQFSNWKMPMNFVPSTRGGTCSPGCHGDKRYTR